jgi:DNA-binding MurR/RpiR family transcriptional regulator
VGRPRIEFNHALVQSLARIGCTLAEIASIAGVSEATLKRRARNEIDKGYDEMRMSLRRWQYEKAKEGSVPMLIWLGKQYLGQRDKIDETRREEVVTIEPFDLPKPRLADTA